MNRQTKRLLARQQAAQDKAGGSGAGGSGRGNGPAGPGGARSPLGRAPGEKKKRTPPRQFLREVRAELKKVAWPTRGEVVTYSVVVLVSVTFVTLFVFGLDSGFTHLVLKVFTK
ncbi:MAG: preprotein translocase subunit SecE [Actinobacteria bacterium]|nr:MAG: preprotein translocase subunit SecE [Actinomycetota bacterium]